MLLVREKGKLRSFDYEREKTYIVSEDKEIRTHDRWLQRAGEDGNKDLKALDRY